MSSRDCFGDRMKCYENVNRTYLTRRTPVIIRIDGRSFHTFTKGFKKPFDDILIESMEQTMKYLCRNIQGCVWGYHQSDEISLVLVDYKKLDTDAWFSYNVQKCASVAASMATMAFNREFAKGIEEIKSTIGWGCPAKFSNSIRLDDQNNKDMEYCLALMRALDRGAMFDARVFNIPKEEVANYLLWRQKDAIRNSVEMVAHCNFSAKQIHGLSCYDLKQKLHDERNINWDALPNHMKYGSSCYQHVQPKNGLPKKCWIVDGNVLFTVDRCFVDGEIFVGEK